MADLSQEVGVRPGGSQPWGDIYTVSTPETDKLGERLWQTERLNAMAGNKQRLASQKAQNSEETKLESNLRGADVGDFTDAYSAYKNASIDFNKNQNTLPINDRIQGQLNVNGLYSKALQLANDSKVQKATDLQDYKDYHDPKNANLYADNAGDLLTKRMATPLSKLNAVPIIGEDGKPTTIDLTDPKSLLYKSTTDFAPDLTAAKGKIQTLNEVDNSKSTDLVHNINQYKGFNNPNNYYNTLVSSVASDDTKNKVLAGKRIKDFVSTYGNISDNDYATTEAKYNNLIADPNYQKAYGTIQPFPASADNTQTGKIAKYLAMNHALDNQPVSQLVFKDNKGNILADEQAFALRKQANDLANKKNLYDYQQAESKGQGQEFLDNNFNSLYNSNGTPLVTKKADGTVEKATVLNAPTVFKKSFSAETNVTDPTTGKTTTKEVLPDDIVKLDNGNLKGYYYQRDGTGNIVKDPTTGQYAQRTDITPIEVNKDIAKTVYGKILASEAKTYSNSSSKTTSKTPTGKVKISW